MIRRFVIAGMLVLAAPVWAEAVSETNTLEERAPTTTNPKKDEFLTLNVENDMFGGNSDRHYTNGVRLSYFNVLARPPVWAQTLSDALPVFDVSDKTAVFYSVGQNLYSPDDIKVANPAPGQRPYAGYLYGSAGFLTLTDNHIDEFELTAGVVGPTAMGKETQTLVHRWVGSPKPMGWEHYQLHNEPALGFSWRRRYPELLHWTPGGWYAAIDPSYELTAGNVYTYAGTGVTFRFGPESSRWQDTPPLVRPNLPGSGYFADSGKLFDWYVFASLNTRAMARNIFLDGNSFRSSPHVEKKVLVGDGAVGLATTFGRARVTYTLNKRSEEYNGQPKGDVFGAVSLGWRF